MTRITPDEVRRAFEQIGGVATRFLHGPETADYEPHETRRDPRCCCGLYAVAAANGWPLGYYQCGAHAYDRTLEQIAPIDYQAGFVGGWDGRGYTITPENEHMPHVLGYLDGQAAWEACEAFREPEPEEYGDDE